MSAISAIAAETIFDLEYERCLALGRADNQNSWGRDMGAAISNKLLNRQTALPRDLANESLRDVRNVESLKSPHLHSVPSSPHKHGAEDMSEAIGTITTKSGDPRDEARTSLKVAFRQHVTDPAKVVAQKVGASADSIEAYRQGKIPQSWAQMIAFCRAYPAFGLEALELMGIDIDRDRDSYAMFLSLQRQMRGS